MALMQRDLNANYFKGTRSHSVTSEVAVDNSCVIEDADAGDDRQWDEEFESTPQTLACLAAQSRAHRDAGRTKRITL